MKTYKKCEFSKDKLIGLSPGGNLLILCESYKEIDSVKQICYNTKLREPRNDVLRYKIEADTDNLFVLITAVPTTTI